MKQNCKFPDCDKPARKLKLCPAHYGQHLRGEDLRPLRAYLPMPDRFWAKVDKTDTCWLWTASRSNKGYGQFGIGPKIVKAHRWSYETAYGPIPGGMQIDHICRVTSCVNPSHLRLATNKQNRENTVAFATNKSGVAAERDRERAALRRGICPYSGSHLTSHGEGIPGTLSCGVCDCFGFQPAEVGR